MPGSESKLQRKIIRALESRGWLVNKIIVCSRNGWPDLEALKDGQVGYIEVKSPGSKARPLQLYVHSQIIEKGGFVFVVDSWEKFEEISFFS